MSETRLRRGEEMPVACTRRWLLAAAAYAFGAGAVGCSKVNLHAPSGGGTEAGENALRIMGNPYNDATYDSLARAFTQQSSELRVQVSFSPRESDEIVRALLLRTFAGESLPDVAFLNGDLVRIFAERGLLMPLDAVLAREGDHTLRTVQVGPVTYGISFGLSVPVVVYNSALMQRAGLDLRTLPQDWSGVFTIARAINERVPDTIGGFIEHDNGGAFTFLCLLQSFGLTAMTADERDVAFDSARGGQALHVLRSFGEAGQADADMSRRQARRAFAAGGIGVLVTMSSVIPYLERMSAKRFQVHATALPLARPSATVPAAGPVAVLFATDPQRAPDSWRFVRFAAGMRGQTILNETSGYLPVRDLPRSQVSQRQLSSFVEPHRVTPWYTFPGRNSLKIAELIQDEMQQVATLQRSPEHALQSIARSVRRLLERRN